jgi:hypothetical protein
MISDTKKTVPSEDPEEKSMSPRILELREKIRDAEYLDSAIQRIAQVLSNRLVENSGQIRLKR